eukprot:540481-Pelagomonas_calceolata.AAC.3
MYPSKGVSLHTGSSRLCYKKSVSACLDALDIRNFDVESIQDKLKRIYNDKCQWGPRLSFNELEKVEP